MLLLPDTGRTWWSWRHVLAGLGRAGVPAAALDPRGAGASDKTPTGYTPDDVRADLGAVLTAVGVPGVVLVGHGWGGLQAAELGAQVGGPVRSVVAVAAPTPVSLQGYRRLQLAAALGAGVLSPTRLRRRAGWDGLPDSAPCVLGLAQWPGPQRAIAPLRGALRHRARARLPSSDATSPAPTSPAVPGVAVPVRHVRGSADRLLPDPAAGVEAVTVLVGGHQLPEERPEELTALLLEVCARSG